MTLRHLFITLYIIMVYATQTATAKNVMWYNGVHPVSYSVNSKPSKVVEVALEMFADDMQAVTGKRAKEKKRRANIAIYQLDRLTNKEFKELDKLRLPIKRVITQEDAFLIKVRNQTIYVIGSNGRGTAYGILELSRLAGVSPWIWWGDVTPERKDYLLIDEEYEKMRQPSIARRGFAIDYAEESLAIWAHRQMDSHRPEGTIGHHTYSRLCRLLLRLRGNTLWPATHEGAKDFSHTRGNKEVADSCDIHIDQLHRSQPIGPGTLYYQALHHQGWPHDYLWLDTTQPGKLAYDLKRAYDEGRDQQWIVSIHDPKVAAYSLSLFMDAAWDADCVTKGNAEQHLQQWVKQQFGEQLAQRIVPVMKRYYYLTAVRKPEHMGWNIIDEQHTRRGVANTDFNPSEFGNELDRYLLDYQSLCAEADRIGKDVPQQWQDAYFAMVSYPVHMAAAMAEKHLQAQEARTIPRKGRFLHDEEAMTAGANSVNAYRKILRMTDYYNHTLAGGKWNGLVNAQPRQLAVFQKPALPDELSDERVDEYADAQYQCAPLRQDVYGIVARNACDYTRASDEVTIIPLAGHSMRAVSIPTGTSVRYDFRAPSDGEYILTLAFVPMTAADDADLRYQLSVDGDEAKTYNLQAAPQSTAYQQSALRGQTLHQRKVRLRRGNHSFTIRAIDHHILLDQWLLDSDLNRRYYVIPVQPAM